jgi:hypothetical protein
MKRKNGKEEDWRNWQKRKLDKKRFKGCRKSSSKKRKKKN